jgi:hypothetical protein
MSITVRSNDHGVSFAIPYWFIVLALVSLVALIASFARLMGIPVGAKDEHDLYALYVILSFFVVSVTWGSLVIILVLVYLGDRLGLRIG